MGAGLTTHMTEAVDRSIGRSFGVAMFLLAPVGLFLPRALALVFVGLAVMAVITLVRRRGESVCWPKPAAALLLLLGVWSMLSAVWSITPGKSIQSSLSVLPLFAAGLCLVVAAPRMLAGHRDWAEKCLIWGVVVGALLVSIEVYFGFPISTAISVHIKGKTRVVTASYGISRGMSVIALLAWFAAYLLWARGNRAAAAAIIGFVAIALLGSDNEAAVFAFAMGLAAFLMTVLFRHWTGWVVAAIVCVGVLAGPLAVSSLPDARTMSKTVPGLGYGVYPRLFIWQSAAKLIGEKPILGHGFRSSRAFSSNANSEWVRIGPTDDNRVTVEPIPLHPHNAPLQLWLELGIVGVAFGLGIVLSIVGFIHKSPGHGSRRAVLYATLASALTLASISYGLWQGWWQCSLWIIAAIGAAMVMRDRSEAAEGFGTH